MAEPYPRLQDLTLEERAQEGWGPRERELATLKEMNRTLRNVNTSIEVAKEHMETVYDTVGNADQLLDLWIKTLARAEQTHRLLENPNWHGAMEDIQRAAEEADRIRMREEEDQYARQQQQEQEEKAKRAEEAEKKQKPQKNRQQDRVPSSLSRQSSAAGRPYGQRSISSTSTASAKTAVPGVSSSKPRSQSRAKPPDEPVTPNIVEGTGAAGGSSQTSAGAPKARSASKPDSQSTTTMYAQNRTFIQRMAAAKNRAAAAQAQSALSTTAKPKKR